MKILTPIGSKERFLEMYQGVTKSTINEGFGNQQQTSTQLIYKAFDELKNRQANVQQTNTQTVNDENYVEIITSNGQQKITFSFKVSSAESEVDDVYNVGGAQLVSFKIDSETTNVDMPENMESVKEFNTNRASEIMDVVSEYADFETNTAASDGSEATPEMQEEATKTIDNMFAGSNDAGGVNVEDSMQHNFDLIDNESKGDIINYAKDGLMAELGERINDISKQEFFQMVKERATEIFVHGASGLNEEGKKSEYPDQIGTKFKPKNQMPKKKKKPQSVVKISEEFSNDIQSKFDVEPEVGDDSLDGGIGDNADPKDFDSEQIGMGIKVEMEHTNDPMTALEITLDHLTEIPDYYTRLDKMEDDAGVEDDTDELLGYKPHNVNDYASEEESLDEDDEPIEFEGNVGDRFKDAENNEFTVSSKDHEGGVTLRGNEGEKETSTDSLEYMKKLSEEQIDMAKRTLNNRGLNEGMSKKEAVNILILNSIK